MSELLEKLSSYNLFNYLVPGVVFVFSASNMTSYSFVASDVFTAAFIFYFAGMVVSRVGSILIEPMLRKAGIIKFAKYEDYVAASKSDPLIETLSEVNNSYRTMSSVFFCLLVLIVFEKIGGCFPALAEYSGVGLVAFLFALFAFSYRKQAIYVYQRIIRAAGADAGRPK